MQTLHQRNRTEHPSGEPFGHQHRKPCKYVHYSQHREFCLLDKMNYVEQLVRADDVCPFKMNCSYAHALQEVGKTGFAVEKQRAIIHKREKIWINEQIEDCTVLVPTHNENTSIERDLNLLVDTDDIIVDQALTHHKDYEIFCLKRENKKLKEKINYLKHNITNSILYHQLTLDNIRKINSKM